MEQEPKRPFWAKDPGREPFGARFWGVRSSGCAPQWTARRVKRAELRPFCANSWPGAFLEPDSGTFAAPGPAIPIASMEVQPKRPFCAKSWPGGGLLEPDSGTFAALSWRASVDSRHVKRRAALSPSIKSRDKGFQAQDCVQPRSFAMKEPACWPLLIRTGIRNRRTPVHSRRVKRRVLFEPFN